jgi:hypothetical protein
MSEADGVVDGPGFAGGPKGCGGGKRVRWRVMRRRRR